MHTRLGLRRSACHQNCLLHKTFKTGPGNTLNTFALAVPTHCVRTTWLPLATEKSILYQGLVTHRFVVSDRGGGLEIIYIQQAGGAIHRREACCTTALVQPPPLCAPQMVPVLAGASSPSTQLPVHPTVSISHPATRVSRI